MTKIKWLVLTWLGSGAITSFAQTAATNVFPGLRNATILIVRHAEKPETGMELTPAGTARADAYTNYFRKLTIDSKPVKLDWLFAAADSKNSHRPRLTLEPLSKTLGLSLDLKFKDKEPELLAQELKDHSHGQQILICWHHGQIPNLIQALGGEPAKLLPGGKWPDDVFCWMIELRYDQDGHLIPGEARCIDEDLMPGDAEKKIGA